jgi:sulfite dehydrogenase (quinone) subunit SoeC
MHPARSVIFFTTASGAGYGLMIWLAFLAATGLLPRDMGFGLAAFGLGFALIVSGLLSQWRSSWLSREGVAAILAFVPLGLFALGWIFNLAEANVAAALGLAGAVMSLLTLFTTAMIYASLKTIPAWHNGWSVAGYLIIGPMNGAVLLALLTALFGYAEAAEAMRVAAPVLLAAGLTIKLLYWRRIHTAATVSTAGTATGLGHLGKVEMTASPHDLDNYLLREMGFHIARKHADKLRRMALLLGFVVPIIAFAAAMLTETGLAAIMLSLLAAAACQIGVTCERWLFFAEAKHVVTLFYGEQAV